MYLGDFVSGDTVHCKFTTVNTSGAPTTLAGTPAISIYKSDNTTQTTTGVTLTVDFDSVTGCHHVAIATSDAFYATGTEFQIVITAGTVDGTSVVGYVVGHFSIQNRKMGVRSMDNGVITAAVIATDAIGSDEIASTAANEIADALLDRANGIETGLTLREALRLISAAEAGKLSGAATTTVTIRNAVADTKARITATVDSDGNRTAITTDLT